MDGLVGCGGAGRPYHPDPRALGLALIVVGDLMVGGTSMLHALDGSGIWRGDVLFMLASMVWASYSVLVRRWALDAVRTTIAITAFAFVTYVPVYSALLWLQWVPGRVWVAPWHDVAFQMVFQGVGSVVISGITFTKVIQRFWARALDHDHRFGAGFVGAIGGAGVGRTAGLERAGRAGTGYGRHCVWGAQE